MTDTSHSLKSNTPHVSFSDILLSLQSEKHGTTNIDITTHSYTCTICNRKITQIQELINALRETYITPPASAALTIMHPLTTDQDINHFIKTLRHQSIPSRNGFHHRQVLAIVLIVFLMFLGGILGGINFGYFLAYNKSHFLQSSHPVTVIRSGLWFGQFTLSTQHILSNRDSIQIHSPRTTVDTNKGMRITAMPRSHFSLHHKNRIVKAVVAEGEYFFSLQHTPNTGHRDQIIELPGTTKIAVMGDRINNRHHTGIYILATPTRQIIYISTGTAWLERRHTVDSPQIDLLSPGIIYHLSGNQILSGQPATHTFREKIRLFTHPTQQDPTEDPIQPQ